MGNAISESSPLFTAEDLKWKTGSVTESVPAPGIGKVTTYENLHASTLFKDYLVKHVDSDYLVSSIMSCADDDAILLKGIEKFKNLEPEWIDSLQKLVENFELCASAGIDVKENDPLTMCEKQLAVSFRSSHAPFLTSFQRRLACLRIMQICIELERKDALATFPTKKSSEPDPSPANQAQLMVLHGLKNAGVSLISVFPMCYRALVEQTQRQLLMQPVKLFCEHLCNMSDLELLVPVTQSVTEAVDPRLLDLRAAAEITASSGPHSCVHDNNQDTYWTGTHLTINFRAPHDVASVTLAWVPKYRNHARDCLLARTNTNNAATDGGEVGAPRRVALFARTVDGEGSELPKEQVFCVLPSAEHAATGTWVQTYQVGMLRVKSLKFTLSLKGCDENIHDISKLYNIDVTLSHDSAHSKIRTLPLLKEVQSALTPLSEFQDVCKGAYDAQFSIVRSSGSLSLLLALINSIYTAKSEATVQRSSAHAILKLLQAVNTTNYSICSTYNKLYVNEGAALSNVKFTSSTAEVSSTGSSVSCTNKMGVALLNFELTSGTYEWSFTLDAEINADESVFLGVVGESCRSLSPESVLKSSEAYFVRCFNGEIFQGRRCCALPVQAMHQGDVCRFVYSSDRRTVSLWVNETAQGVVFDHLTAIIRPCVLFTRSAHTKRVSVSGASLTSTILTGGASDKVKLPLSPKPTLTTVQSAESVLALLLTEVQQLAISKQAELAVTLNGALVHAYSVECSMESILLLIALIEKLKADLDAAAFGAASDVISSMLRSLLVVLDLQFQSIKLSKVDLKDLGFYKEYVAVGSAHAEEVQLQFEALSAAYANTGRFTDRSLTHSYMRAASLVLQRLMSSAHSSVLSGAAVTAFSHGLSFFLPSTEAKIALIADILANMDVSNMSSVASEPRLKLLQLLIQRFRETSEILSFIDFVASNAQHAPKLCSLVAVLMELLVTLQSDAAGFGEKTDEQGSVSNSSSEFDVTQKAALTADLSALVSTYQQQLVYEILATTPHPISGNTVNSGVTPKARQAAVCKTLLLPYIQALLASCRRFILLTLGADIAQESRRDTLLRESVVGALVQPLLYALCLPGFELSFYQELCPDLVRMLELLTQYSSASTACATANSLLLSTIPRASSSTSSKSGLGWRTIKASFEDSEGTFTATDNNSVYTSVTTSNTAAIVTTKFTTKQKGAWEFVLEADSSGDECSTFGAARGPPTSRCYSSSPDLWMRRAYNGYLYALGSSTGQVLDKIKPGDTVRVEYDGKAGTLSFGLNGSDVEVAFSGITEDVYPACGSYRNGVSIRLSKVEIFDTLDDVGEDEISTVSAFARPCKDIKWVLDEDNFVNTRDSTLLSPAVSKGSKLKTPTFRWVTARADRGALYGVHEYTFELMHVNKSPFSVGVMCGGSPYPLDRLAGPCLKISSKSPKTCEISGSSLRLGASEGSVAGSGGDSTPVAAETGGVAVGLSPFQPPPPITIMPGIAAGGVDGSAVSGSSMSTAPPSPTNSRFPTPVLLDSSEHSTVETSGSVNTLVTTAGSSSSTAFAAKEQSPELPFSRTYRYQSGGMALAWHSDGSLWHNGLKVADEYGIAALPLNKNAAIAMRVDRTERTVSFAVNGVSLGVAFGPTGSGAKAHVSLPRVGAENTSMFPSEARAVFPAGSIASSAQALRIRSTGFQGSTVLPLQMSVQRALTSVLGRLSALLIQGPGITPTEAALIPWFASNLMIGGLEESVSTLSAVADSETIVWDVVTGFAQYSSLATGHAKNEVDSALAWLEKVDPEPDFLRKALEKSDSYRFPAVEMPFIACLLKHSGLGAEVAEVVRRSRDGVAVDGEAAVLPVASGEMKSLWQRVKQLRVYLRQQRQSFRAIGIAIQNQSTKAAPVVAAPEPVTPATSTVHTLPPRPPRLGQRTRRQLRSTLDTSSSSDNSENEEAEEADQEDDDPEILFGLGLNRAHDEHDDREDGEALMDMLAVIQGSLLRSFPLEAPAVSSVTATADAADPQEVVNPYLQAPTSPVRAELPDESGGESLIYYTDHIHWTAQPTGTVTKRTDADTCTVLSVGIDYTNELIFVRLHERFDTADTHKYFQSCRLIINESVAMTAAEVQSNVNTPHERRGCLRFDCSSIAKRFFQGLTGTAVSEKSSLKFQFGSSEYSTVDLELPVCADVISELSYRGIKFGTEIDAPASAEVDVAAQQFAKLCDVIRNRAEFLLTLTPAVKSLDSTDYRSKSLLHTLTKRYSGNFRSEDLSRWRAQERWKRVVEFLHVQSRTLRDPSAGALLPPNEHASSWDMFRASRVSSAAGQAALGTSQRPLPPLARVGSTGSGSVLSEQDLQEAADSDSPVLASMQACAIFMVSDAIQATPADLTLIMSTRVERSESRVLGFQTLISILDIVSDPLTVSELLMYVRSALKITLPVDNALPHVDKTLFNMVSKHHYLNCLEGCSTRTLARVQDAFVDLYTVLSSLLRRCIAQWEHGARSACVRSRDGSFSPTRSFRAMLLKNESEDQDDAAECDPTTAHILLEPIQSLLECWTLHFSTRDHRWLHRIGIVPSLMKLTSVLFQEEVARTWRDSAERCTEFHKANFARSAARKSKAKWEMWSKQYVHQGLRNGTLTMRRIVHYLFNIPESELSSADRTEIGLTDSFARALDTWSDSQVVSMYHNVLKIVSRKRYIADSEKKAQQAEVEAAEAARLLTILQRISPCGVFDAEHKARQIVLTNSNLEAHLVDDGGGTAVCAYTNVQYDVATGPALSGNYFEVTIVHLGRKAIGIGFADRDVFSATGYMPGWERHSYGYHGDDGHKFGAGSTPGDFPLFEAGDVIGCGFDFASRSIFYTRNGTLLGTGFTNISDLQLWPVVGFANRSRLREQVKINFGIQPFVYEADPLIVINPLALAERTRAENEDDAQIDAPAAGDDIVSENASNPVSMKSSTVFDFADSAADLVCSSRTEFEQKSRELRVQLAAADAFCQELSGLRKQSELVLRFLLTLACNSDSEGSGGGLLHDLPASSTTGAADPLVPPMPVLTKEVSLFGTPKAFTVADGVCLQESILEHIAHEFLLAVAFLESPENSRVSFQSLQAAQDFPGLDGSSSPSNGPAGIISAEEVSRLVHSHLVLISSLHNTSKIIQAVLQRPAIINALFALTEQPHVRNRNAAFCLLSKILPFVQPETIEESLNDQWLGCVRTFDALLVGSQYRKRMGKMPISLIQALSLTSSVALSTVSQAVAQSAIPSPYGAGTRALELADLKLILVQRLFEAPLWTELVACAVTDALRNAGTAVDRITSSSASSTTKGDAASTQSLEAVDIAVLQLACSACVTLNSLGVCRTGTKVKVNSDSTGVLLSYSETTQSASYVLDRNIRVLNPNIHVASAPLSALESVVSVVAVDLTDLSQPLLQQFFQLTEKVFTWFRCRRNTSRNGGSTDGDNLLHRLTSLVSFTLSHLLAHQSDVINFVHDSAIISDLLSIALTASDLPCLPTGSGVLQMWRSTQMRCLELPPSTIVATANTFQNTISSVLSVSGDGEVTLTANTSDKLDVEETHRAERLAAAQLLSTELGAEERLCLLYLDFHAMNVAEARDSIRRVQGNASLDPEVVAFFTGTDSAGLSVEATYEDSNLLNKIANYDPADLLLSTSFAANKSSGFEDSPYAQWSLLSTREFVRRATETGVGEDELVLLVHSDLDGRRPAVSGVRQYVRARVLIDAVTEVSALNAPKGSTKSKSSADKLPDCFLQTQYLDSSHGYTVCDLIDPTATHSVVTSLYGGVSLSQLPAFRSQVDANLTIQFARNVAAKLLLDGNLNIKQDLPRDDCWVDLVKLVSSSGSESFEKVVPSLCTALTVVGSEVTSPTNALVNEVTTNLLMLSNPLTLTDSTKTRDNSTFLEFASPHPFPAPADSSGTIRIPAHWKNISLQFHPKCSTPSERAVLEFFTSEEALAARLPVLSLSGIANNWAAAQNKCISGPLSSLYYRFTAAPASDRLSFPLLVTDGGPIISHNKCALPPNNHNVGLGEEDSLFNLFDTNPVADGDDLLTGTVECGVGFIASGTWYYEATITQDGPAGEGQCLVGIISSEFDSGDKTMQGSMHACAVFGDGLVCMHSALKYHDAALGEWKRNDVVGCLFDLSESCVGMWVHKNGVWSPKVTGSVSTASWKPAVSIAGSFRMSLNWGETRFVHSPPTDIVLQLSSKSYQGVAFYTPPEEDSEVAAARIALAWGYHFTVRPFVNVRMRLSTEFDLMKKVVFDAAGTDRAQKSLWFWRTKACEGFLPWGDIVTSTEYPPLRAVLLDKNQCKAPTDMKCVFSHTKHDFAVMRLVPPAGYVCLGDIALASHSPPSSPASMLSKFLCVPEWAVRDCAVSDFLAKLKDCGSGKEVSTGSLWGVDSGLGAFFGSPFDSRYSHESEGKTKSSAFEHYSVGRGYALVCDLDLQSKLTGEWTTEATVLTAPSLQWTTALLRSLLHRPTVRTQVLTPAVFLQLVQFLRSSASSRPLAVVPLLIQMIRLAQKDKVKLPLDEIKSLCKSILTLAMTFTGSRSAKIPNSLLKLVDFVIEIQIAHIEDTYEKDNFNLFRRFVLINDSKRGHSQMYILDKNSSAWMESKEEEDGFAGIESKESEPLPLVRQSSADSATLLGDTAHNATEECLHSETLIAADLEELARREAIIVLSGKWWDRVSVPAGLLRLHRGLKLSNIENIFARDSTILRLRQVLKFINAIVSSSGASSAFALKQHTQSTSEALHRDRPYPRFLSSKIWFDLASTSAVEQSSHPYRSEAYRRRLHFPGAEKLLVTFDRRCALTQGDTLRVCSFTGLSSGRENESVTFSHTTTDEVWGKGLSVQGDEVTFVLESAHPPSLTEDENAWGWSCVVFASGNIYKRADTVLNLSDLPGVSSVDTSLEESDASDAPTGDPTEEAKEQNAASPFRAVVAGLTASVSPGSSAAEFATHTLDTLRGATDSEVSCSSTADTLAAVDWVKQLVCLRGQLLHSGEVAVPMSHSLRVLFDHVPSTDTDSASGTPKVLVVECTPRYACRAGQVPSKSDGVVFRVCIANKFERSLHTSVRGDTVAFRVFGMTEENLLQILSAIPVASPSASPKVTASTDSSGDSSEVIPALTTDTEVEPVPEPESEPEAELDTSEQMWACEVCTLLNAPHLTECGVCTSLRPSAASGGAPGGSAASSAEVGWWCTACTLINPISVTSCNACGTARDTTGATGGTAESAEDGEEDEEDQRSEESSRSGTDTSASSEDLNENEEDLEDDEDDDGADTEEAAPSSISDAKHRAEGKARPAGDKDASLVSRMSGETKARVLSLKAGDDLVIITLEGKMSEVEEFEARLLGAMASHGVVQTPAQMMCGLTDWTHEDDCELIEQINAAQSTSTQSHLFTLPKKFLTYCSTALASKDLLEIQVRAQHIERFNKHLEHLLSFIDLGSDDPRSLGAMIRKCNRYLLLKVKTPLLDSAITSTTVTSGKDCPASLVLDNTKALQSRDREEKDPTTSQNCFVQAYQQLRTKDPLVYRCLTSSDRVFMTSFVGESGIDAGGVYREAMSRIVEDLFSEHFDLLLLCPNAQQQVHSNMDKFVPNPSHSGSKLAKEMYEFVGKVMAVSVRTKLYLPFEFPPVVWKKLVGEEVGTEDFMSMDAIACKQVESVRAWDLDKVEPSKLRFEYQGSDKVVRELVPGGKNKTVTCENRFEYCNALTAARLSEFNEAAAAIARGMSEVIPSRALWLFSSTQLETLVCGSPVFDLDLWKKKTDSTGLSAKTVELFWKVMETLTQKELAGFVRFAWGRSRLPAAKEFTTKMRLTHGGTAPLPVSHTCFFSVELPEYPTEEAMRHGLLTAIHYGVGGILNG